MELGTGFTDAGCKLLLDVHVDILEIEREAELARRNLFPDFIQSGLDGSKLVSCEITRSHQRPCMGDASQDVVAIKPPVKRDGFTVIPEEIGHGFFETTVTHPLFLADFDEIESKNPKKRNEVEKSVRELRQERAGCRCCIPALAGFASLSSIAPDSYNLPQENC